MVRVVSQEFEYNIAIVSNWKKFEQNETEFSNVCLYVNKLQSIVTCPVQFSSAAAELALICVEMTISSTQRQVSKSNYDRLEIISTRSEQNDLRCVTPLYNAAVAT